MVKNNSQPYFSAVPAYFSAVPAYFSAVPAYPTSGPLTGTMMRGSEIQNSPPNRIITSPRSQSTVFEPII